MGILKAGCHFEGRLSVWGQTDNPPRFFFENGVLWGVVICLQVVIVFCRFLGNSFFLTGGLSHLGIWAQEPLPPSLSSVLPRIPPPPISSILQRNPPPPISSVLLLARPPLSGVPGSAEDPPSRKASPSRQRRRESSLPEPLEAARTPSSRGARARGSGKDATNRATVAAVGRRFWPHWAEILAQVIKLGGRIWAQVAKLGRYLGPRDQIRLRFGSRWSDWARIWAQVAKLDRYLGPRDQIWLRFGGRWSDWGRIWAQVAKVAAVIWPHVIKWG